MSTTVLEKRLYVAEPPARFLVRPPIVVDASTVCAILFDEGLRHDSAHRIAGRMLYASHLLDHEVVSAAARRFPGASDSRQIGDVLEDYLGLEIELCDTDVRVQFDLAMRYRLDAYSAAYLCLAAEMRVPLATYDRHLAEAARIHLGSLN